MSIHCKGMLDKSELEKFLFVQFFLCEWSFLLGWFYIEEDVQEIAVFLGG